MERAGPAGDRGTGPVRPARRADRGHHRVPAPGAAAAADLLGHAGPARGTSPWPRPGPDEEHSYLPDKAMALIAGVPAQALRSARSASSPAERARGRHLRLLYRTSRLLPARPPGASPVTGRAGPGTGVHGRASGLRLAARWMRAHMAWAGWASVGAAPGRGSASSSVPCSAARGPPEPGVQSRGCRPARPRRRTPCAARRATSGGAPGRVHDPAEPGLRQCRVGSSRPNGFAPGKPVTVRAELQ